MTAPTTTLEDVALSIEAELDSLCLHDAGYDYRAEAISQQAALVRAAAEVVEATRKTHPLSPAQEKALAAFDAISQSKGEEP